MSSLSAVSSKVSNLNHLRQLHARIIQACLPHHNYNYWAAFLITHCTRLRAPLPYASCIFNSAINPNVFVFTNMLKFFSTFGAHSQVIDLFYQMRNCGIAPDAFVYAILIKSSGKGAFLLHGHVLKLGHVCDRYVRNAVMDCYAKFGQIEDARKLFDEMPDRAIADWNSMISGYWKSVNEVEACKLFELMPERDVVTWTAMVTGYYKVKDLENARRYFDQMPQKNVVSWNAILSGYAQNGFAVEAINLFKEMMNAGVQPDETTWVAVISACSSRGDSFLSESLVKVLNNSGIRTNCFVKTALLDMYAKCGNLEAARKIFDELGTHRNSVTWNAMISAYARVGDLNSARDLFDKMPQKNVVSWNSMISGYAQNGLSAMAIELFKEMLKTNNSIPDEVTMISVISACGHMGALELGNWLVSYLARSNIKLSISGHNSIIFMYSKCGNMKDAKRIFQELDTRDIFSYNTLLTGFAAYGHGFEAVEQLDMMKQENVQPDRITYISVLTACSHAGLLEEGKKVFGSIKNPDIDHYACMVDLLGRVGKLDEAKKLIDEIPMRPHAGVYGSLLNASRVYKRVDLAELAAKNLFELEPEHSGNYVLLSNIYALEGRWKDVEMVREKMRNMGLRKPTGWSWVEYGGKIHKFIVGDRSHERSDDIYKILEEFRKKIRIGGYIADKSCVLRDVEEEEKEEMVGIHSEKLAIAFALLVSEEHSVIRVVKNLRICWDCHTAIKIIAKMERREIIVRDNNRFHCFKNGFCSCNDYW